jgi:hypothetical protein
VGLLGPNAHGELLEPDRVPDCYLGLLLRAGDPDRASGVLVVSPATLLHPAVPRPDRTLVYELLTGYPDREPRLAARHLEGARRRPAGGRQRGHRLLAARPRQGPPLRGADRRGRPGVGAAGHGLGARGAPRPGRPPDQRGVPAVAEPDQWTPARRRLPVTLAAVSAVDSGRPDTRPRFRKQKRTGGRCRSVRFHRHPDTVPRRCPRWGRAVAAGPWRTP